MLPRSMGRALAAPLVCAWLLAAPAQGEEFLELMQEETAVYAASRYVLSLAETPANVSVLTRSDIERYGWRTIADALATLPGIYGASSQWPALGVRGVAIPGDFGSRILFMVNGMPVYEPTYGSFFVELVDIESVDRIEFVRGTGSALYGSGAVMGVVNLVTAEGKLAAGKSASIQAARHGNNKIQAQAGGATERGGSYFFSASAGRRDGRDLFLPEYAQPFNNNGFTHGNDWAEEARLFGRYSRGEGWLQALYVGGYRSDPLASYGTVFNTDKLRLRETLMAVEAGMNRDLPGGARLTGRLYGFRAAEEGDYPYNNNTPQNAGQVDFINVTDLSSRQLGAELRYDGYVGDNHRLLGGVEAKHVASEHRGGDQAGPVRDGSESFHRRPSYSQYALFLQDEALLGEGRKLFLGARYDHYQSFSAGVRNRLSPRAAYVHTFSPQSVGKLIYGEAFRAPTLYESRYQDGEPRAETLWANPDLKPEIAKSLEALWENEVSPLFKWNLSAFDVRLRDTPVLVDTPTLNGLTCVVSCNQYRNSGAVARTRGVEGSASVHGHDGLLAYGSLTLQRSRQGSTGDELPSSPRHLLKAGVSRPLAAGWDGALELSHVGRVQGIALASGGRSATAPAYTLANANVNARLGSQWKLSLRATNLLNQKIYTVASPELQPLERVPGTDRTYSLRLTHPF